MPKIDATEVAIVGAGPAGLAGAAAAAESGCRVTLIDSYPRNGGQYYKQLPTQFQALRPASLHRSFNRAERLFTAVEQNSNVRVLNNTTAWSIQPCQNGEGPFTLFMNDTEKSFELEAEKIILAPGAYDRALPFPGWDLPGVITAGGAQTLVKSQRILPGKKIVLSGSGPFLLPVAAALAKGGAEIAGLYEATHPIQWVSHSFRVINHFNKLVEGFDYLKELRKSGISLKFGRAVVRVEGDGKVERVTVARLNPDWTIIAGSEEQIEADTVCTGFGFLPSTELSYLIGCDHYYDPVQGAFFASHDKNMQTSVKGSFVAGEITGIGGSGAAVPQGSLAGYAAAQQLGRLKEREAQSLIGVQQKAVQHQQTFTDIFNQIFKLRPGWQSWIEGDTTVCRCEEVTVGEVKKAITDFKAYDAKTVKLTTRCGMGLCQGRVCGHIVTALVSDLTDRNPAAIGTFTSRPIVKPLFLEQLINE